MHKARKRFGQNFLTDPAIISQIVHSIQPQAEDCMVEIGPGLGALTLPLLDILNRLYVVELDRDLVDKLQAMQHPKLTIFSADALQFDFKQIGCENPLRVIGNLPYNISTPLLFYLLTFGETIQDMHFMLQKELVHRICASSHSKAYGRLSVMVQAHCDVYPVFDVPPEAFDPAPKVDSAIVHLIPKHGFTPPETLNIVVKTAFAKRRKTLRNNLKDIIPLEKLDTVPLDLSLRAEHIPVVDYLHLASWYQQEVLT